MSSHKEDDFTTRTDENITELAKKGSGYYLNFKIEQNGEISERNILIIKMVGKTPNNFPIL